MSAFIPLVRAGLKANFGLSVLRYRIFKEKKDIWLLPLIGLAGIGVLPSLYGLILLIQNIFLALKPFGQERVLLTVAVLAGQLFVVIFGLYYIISAFYFSKDLAFLIPLPLKPMQVMASKFAIILANEYLTVMIIVVPVLAVFGAMAKPGPAYWIVAVLVYMALPVIPLALVSIVVVAMMRLINFSRKKDALILIGSLVLIAASLALQFAAGRAGNRQLDGQALVNFLASPDSLLNRVGARFPPSVWAAKALAGGFSSTGLLNLVLFLGVSAALLGAMLVVSEKLFYRGLIGVGEVSARRRSLTAEQISRRVTSGRHPVRAIFIREWRIMNRTPIFVLNGVLVVVIIPVVFVLMALMGSGRGSAGALLKMMASVDPFYVILAAAGFMTLCGSLNGTASSTFSREGGQFWISQVIPVAPRDQVAAKFFHSYLISGLGVVTASLVCVFAFHLKAGVLIPAVFLALLVSIPLDIAGMLIDLARPLLDWTNPQKAIKQNLNVLLAMFADIAILTAVFFFVKLLVASGAAGAAALALLFAALAFLSVLSWRLLVGFAGRRYREIEA